MMSLALQRSRQSVENTFIESFNWWLRDEFLDKTLFTSAAQTCAALEEWAGAITRRFLRILASAG
jgi:hypothetical protein